MHNQGGCTRMSRSVSHSLFIVSRVVKNLDHPCNPLTGAARFGCQERRPAKKARPRSTHESRTLSHQPSQTRQSSTAPAQDCSAVSQLVRHSFADDIHILVTTDPCGTIQYDA
jgi:hypothetical protein